jgi:Zn-dependent M28 family amino/carboxypeptidase
VTAVSEGRDELLASLSAERMMDDVKQVAATIRLAGDPQEALAFDYIEGQLKALGLDVERALCDTYISLPGDASLRVLAPEKLEIGCITHSMSVPTPAEGLTGELVLLGKGAAGDFAGQDIAGKIPVVNSLVSGGVMRRAATAGCSAVVFMNDDHLHQGITSSLYGSPNTRTAAELPTTTAISIVEADGKRLQELLAKGPVTVRIDASIDTGWRDIPVITADIMPENGDGTFAFFGTHVDSWEYGGTDNAAGNAILLEYARVFSQHRDKLRRGVRVLFWSGHSHGRYAGSCWYVDHHWQELYDRAILAMSIDSPGTKGANALGGAKVMDEAVGVATRVARYVTGGDVPAPARPPGGEQPLWRVGIPSMNPVRLRHNKDSGYSLRFAPTSPWWHHTVDDTVDKVDPGNLLTDARIYAAAMYEFVASEVLPYDYGTVARAVLDHLRALPPTIDLSKVLAAATDFEKAIAEMDLSDPTVANRRIRLIGRVTIPALYTLGDGFQPDTISARGFIPTLRGVGELAGMDPAGFESHALRTEMVREANRLEHALRSAAEIARGADRP